MTAAAATPRTLAALAPALAIAGALAAAPTGAAHASPPGAAAPAQPGAPAPPPPGAPARPPAAAAELLTAASAALAAGDHARAAALAESVAGAPGQSDVDRAEAFRILGLARTYLGHKQAAEAAFYAYLRLDPDAHLDPALVPPEAIVLFEGVRSRHAAELAALRPRPRRRRSIWLNVVPLGGQWQNGEGGKMWILGSTGAALLAANITSYVLLHRWCGGADDTCDEGEPGTPGYRDHTGDARVARGINIATFIGLGALYAYSVYDGLRGYRRLARAEAEEAPPPPPPPLSVGVGAGDRSISVTFGGHF